MSPGSGVAPLLPGTTVLDQAGAPLGRIMHLFHDPVSTEPEWASLAPAGAGRWVLVPLAGSTMTPDGVSVAHPGAAVLAGPVAPASDTLGDTDLLAATTYYYGPSATAEPSGGLAGVPGAVPPDEPTVVHGGPDDVVITRSEEQLRTGTESVVAQRLRVRKVVVTEERTITVQVRREELQVDNVPVDDPAPVPGGLETVSPTGDDDLTITLYAERPVVTTDVVAVERVRVVKQVVTEDQVVTATVRREVVDRPEAAPPRG